MCWHRSCVHVSFSQSRLYEQQVLTGANLVFDLHNSPVQMHNSWENEISCKNSEPARATGCGWWRGLWKESPWSLIMSCFGRSFKQQLLGHWRACHLLGRGCENSYQIGQSLRMNVDGTNRLQKSWSECDGSDWFCCMHLQFTHIFTPYDIICHSKHQKNQKKKHSQ